MKRARTKCTPELIEQIAKYLRTGCYLETAAALADVSRSALWEWLRKGREGKQPYAKFLEEVEKALAHVKTANLVVIQNAAQQHWQAAAWLLERRFPNEWAQQNTVRVVSKLATLPDEELFKLAEGILKKRNSGGASDGEGSSIDELRVDLR